MDDSHPTSYAVGCVLTCGRVPTSDPSLPPLFPLPPPPSTPDFLCEQSPPRFLCQRAQYAPYGRQHSWSGLSSLVMTDTQTSSGISLR
eukprot:1212669-Rhodomonas_salina.2